MSGHSKWATIKRKKGETDAARGKVFTKLGREIAIAVKQGGGADPNTNSKLRDVIAKAKAANMPNDNISRSIKKASGDGDNANYEEITYEGYGPGGVAVICECTTDNRNRTAGDLRHYFDKFHGNLGQNGCVSYMFNQKGIILIEKSSKVDEDTLMMEALEAGAEDFNADDDCYEISTDPSNFTAVREQLEAKNYEFLQAEVSLIPNMTTKLTDPEQIKFMDKLLENLEELDDVSNVYHSWEMPEEEDEE